MSPPHTPPLPPPPVKLAKNERLTEDYNKTLATTISCFASKKIRPLLTVCGQQNLFQVELKQRENFEKLSHHASVMLFALTIVSFAKLANMIYLTQANVILALGFEIFISVSLLWC